MPRHGRRPPSSERCPQVLDAPPWRNPASRLWPQTAANAVTTSANTFVTRVGAPRWLIRVSGGERRAERDEACEDELQVGNALSKPWLPWAVGVFVVATIPVVWRAVLLVLCATVVALLALFGFQRVLRRRVDWRFSITGGLGVAVVVFAFLTFV
jgi:hypothetical protein